MEIEDKRIKNKLIILKELQDLQREKYFSWLKNILTLAVGFFGILISLKSDKPENKIQHFFFVLAIASLAYAIFSGVLVLYSEIQVINKVKKQVRDNILKMLENEKLESIKYIGRSKYYNYLEKSCFIGFTITLISLVVYSSIK